MQLIVNKNKLIGKNITSGVIYKKNFKNIPIKIKNLNFNQNFIINSILNLKLINKLYKVKIKEIKYHNYKKLILHIDFLLIQ